MCFVSVNGIVRAPAWKKGELVKQLNAWLDTPVFAGGPSKRARIESEGVPQAGLKYFPTGNLAGYGIVPKF